MFVLYFIHSNMVELEQCGYHTNLDLCFQLQLAQLLFSSYEMDDA